MTLTASTFKPAHLRLLLDRFLLASEAAVLVSHPALGIVTSESGRHVPYEDTCLCAVHVQPVSSERTEAKNVICDDPEISSAPLWTTRICVNGHIAQVPRRPTHLHCTMYISR